MNTSERIHFDSGRIDQYAACGYDLDRNGPDGWTTDRVKVTCSECAGKLVDEQLVEAGAPETSDADRLAQASALLRQAKALIEAVYEVTPQATGQRVALSSASYDIDTALSQVAYVAESPAVTS